MMISRQPVIRRICVVVALLTLVLGGHGCKRSDAPIPWPKGMKPIDDEPIRAPRAAQLPEKKATASPVAGSDSGETKPRPTPPPPAPTPPAVPANVREWGLSYFIAARTLGDARLNVGRATARQEPDEDKRRSGDAGETAAAAASDLRRERKTAPRRSRGSSAGVGSGDGGRVGGQRHGRRATDAGSTPRGRLPRR